MIKKNYPKIAIITPGYKPVPDVAGGAVEHLITQLVLENEKTPHYIFELYTIGHPNLAHFNLQHTNLNIVHNWRKNVVKRYFSYAVNHFLAKFHMNLRINFMVNEIINHLPVDLSGIIMENDLDILRALKMKNIKVPIIFHLHNDFDTFAEMQKTRDAMKWTVNNVSEIWAVSNYVKNHILSHFKNANVKVLQNCIDRSRFSEAIKNEEIETFRKKYGILPDDFVIVYSGRIIRQKGVLELIKAVSLLSEEIPYKLLIVGDMNSAQKRYVHSLYEAAEGLKNKIVFTGYIPQYEIQTAYAAAAIVAVPSQWQEAFCLTALEASCHCKVCIASDSGGLAEVLDSNCAKMIPLGDNYIQNFSNAISELYNEPDIRLKMGINAGKKASTFSDASQYFKDFCALTDNFLAVKRGK